MKIRKKFNKSNKQKLSIAKKSIIFAVLISILVPSLLVIIKNILLYIFSSRSFQNSILILQLPAFLELSMLDLSILWIIVRIIPIIVLAYFNSILINKKLREIKHAKLYLIVSSIIIYFLSLLISILIFDLINLIPMFHTLPKILDFFNF